MAVTRRDFIGLVGAAGAASAMPIRLAAGARPGRSGLKILILGGTGFIGYSASAGKVLVVIAYRDLDGDLHGMNAWPASGRDLATYLEEGDDGEES